MQLTRFFMMDHAPLEIGFHLSEPRRFRAFVRTLFNSVLRENLNPNITVMEVDANMENTAFSKAVIDVALIFF